MTGFRRRAFFEDDNLVGVRWWQDGLLAATADPVTRRSALRKVGLLIAGVFGAGIIIELVSRLGGTSRPDSPPVLRDALELQKEQGWDVGSAGSPLAFPGASTVDSAGKVASLDTVASLADALAPSDERLRPFYVPTLFQAPAAPSSASLRRALMPIHDTAMEEGYGRGVALAELFASQDAPEGTAVLVDASGPIAVSVAAGMADRLAPVFLFDNWPHPAGVVPSQLTLAAALYWLPRFQAANGSRPANAPPVFVGDDARLTPYSDQSDRFDNRYVLRLPSAESFKKDGIQKLLIVRPRSSDVELDDLNDDVVALRSAGITVKIVGLDDFQRGSTSTATATTTTTETHRYYYGGLPIYHTYFWPTYGWSRTVVVRSPPSPYVGRGVSYTPVARPTLFSSRAIGGTAGVGRARPTGFGVVSYRSGGSGSGGGRTGSWGRASSSGGE